MEDLIKPVDLNKTNEESFKYRFVGCIILTQDHKILLQQRGHDWRTFPGYLSTFGGRIEAGEMPLEALVRELREELGADVNSKDAISLGAITEASTGHTELVHTYFWHDARKSITGCYEGEAKEYDDCASILAHPKIMDDVRFLLQECIRRKLISS